MYLIMDNLLFDNVILHIYFHRSLSGNQAPKFQSSCNVDHKCHCQRLTYTNQ